MKWKLANNISCCHTTYHGIPWYTIRTFQICYFTDFNSMEYKRRSNECDKGLSVWYSVITFDKSCPGLSEKSKFKCIVVDHPSNENININEWLILTASMNLNVSLDIMWMEITLEFVVISNLKTFKVYLLKLPFSPNLLKKYPKKPH